MRRIVVDTGPLYALADEDDAWHERVLAFVTDTRPRLVVPITVLPETCYLIAAHLGSAAEVQFVRSIQQEEVELEFLRTEDLSRAVEVMDRYASARLGFVDASIVAVAERLRVRDVLTTDRRHFGLVRPRHCVRFQLYPE